MFQRHFRPCGNNMNDSLPTGLTRRTMLKATAATTAGTALFAGSASATDVGADVDVDCLGDEVKVTLNSVDGTDAANLDGLEVVFGQFDVININDNDRIDRAAEILPCLSGSSDCQPSVVDKTGGTKKDGAVCYTFKLSEAGLDGLSGPTEVAFAGKYDIDSSTEQTFDNLEGSGVLTFDPATCCIECETDSLLVKYEWTGDKFEEEEGSDSNLTLTSVHLDEDDEPEKACFTTSYCDLWAVVKAGTNYDVIQIREDSFDLTEVCVEPTVDRAISNIQFFCEEPDEEDYVLGNSDKSEEDSNGNKGRGKKKGK